MSSQVCHFRYCRVVSPLDLHAFTFHGDDYKLRFADPEVNRTYGLVVERPGSRDEYVDSRLLRWLLVYFGEDTMAPYAEEDTSRIWERGDFVFDPSEFSRFIAACERMPRKSFPQWRVRLFERAIGYFAAGIRGGVYLMPLGLGFFAMCLECLGNYDHGKQEPYHKLGDKRFLQTLNRRLRRHLTSPTTRESAKRYKKTVVADVALLHELRNSFYGHSLMHRRDDRQRLVVELRKLYRRELGNDHFLERSVRNDNLESRVRDAGPALYKVGLRLCRLFIWLALGFTKPPPLASHDFSVLGDLRTGEPLRRGRRNPSARLTP